MANFNLDDYEPVADRITAFWKDHPEGRITTELVHRDDQRFIVKAFICRTPDAQVAAATGYAEEIIGSSNVNRTSALENCETSAIGRALANLGYAVKNRASREEMEKVQTRDRPRQGGMKRIPTPTPEPAEKPTNGVQGHLTVDQAARIAKLKTELANRLGIDEAKQVWGRVLDMFGLTPQDRIPADLIGPLETAALDSFASDRLLAEDQS